MRQRSIGICILLTIITCGIYGIYWFIVLTDDANAASGQPNATSGGVAFLLTLVTCGIYGYYWAYKMGEKINQAKAQRGLPADSSLSIIYLLLQIFGLGIIGWALMQDNLNKLAPTQV